MVGARGALRGVLASGDRGAARGGHGVPAASLVAGQIAVAVLLLSATTLLVRSFRALLGRDLGFTTNVVTVTATPSAPRFRHDTTLAYAYWEQLLGRLRAMPGASTVGLANAVPLNGGGTGFIDIDMKETPNAGAGYRVISEDYLAALGVRLLTGRWIASTDVIGSERVALVNRAMAEKYWPGQSPIGHFVRATSMEAGGFTGTPSAWIRIVGEVSDVRHYGVESDIKSEMYVSWRQVPYWVFGMTAVVRTTGRAEQSVQAVQRVARAVDRTVPVETSTLERSLSNELAPRRMTLDLLSLFGGLALLLSAFGVYGMLAYAVAQRHRELAVRAALGARAWGLLLFVLGDAARVIGVGASVGVLASLAATRVLQSQLVDVAATDPLSLGLAVTVLAAVALAATMVPARRATKADPAEALRGE